MSVQFSPETDAGRALDQGFPRIDAYSVPHLRLAAQAKARAEIVEDRRKLEEELHQLQRRIDLASSVATSTRPAAKQIIQHIANRYGVSVEDILRVSRATRVVEARQVAMADVYRLRPDLGICGISRIFDRDHTCVRSALRKAGLKPPRGEKG